VPAIALVLAGTGVYAVMAFATALRTREIGIRTALGAQPAALLRLLLGHALRLSAAGAALGLLGALAVGRLLGAQLFDVQPGDPVVLGLVVVLLLVVAMAATLLPARRAIRLDPVRALHAE
jgi:putative ABC transport system permease protein